jgi:hypothetical protein
MPPLTHLTAHLVNITLGTGPVVSRLPGMIGFWVFCLCLFRFASRRVSLPYALTALLLPFATASYAYSFEARSYGMLLGFGGLALVSWQAAAEGARRGLALPVLAVAGAGVVACHYYALLIYLPLAGGEALRTLRRRRIDGPVWTAFAAGAVPLLASYAAIRDAVRETAHPWARVRPRAFLDYYEVEFQHTIVFLAIALALIAAWFLFKGPEEPEEPRRAAIPDYELLAAVLFLAIPLAAVAAAIAMPPHIFTERYAVLGIAGFALLVPLAAARLSGGRTAVGTALFIAALAPFLGELAQVRGFVNPLDEQPLLRRALADGPVVVNDGVLYLQLWYYAPPEWKPRLLYVADRPSALRFLGTDTVDFSLRPLPRFAPVPVTSYRDFARPGKEFLVYVTEGAGWLPQKVLAEGGTLAVVEWRRDAALLRARMK